MFALETEPYSIWDQINGGPTANSREERMDTTERWGTVLTVGKVKGIAETVVSFVPC